MKKTVFPIVAAVFALIVFSCSGPIASTPAPTSTPTPAPPYRFPPQILLAMPITHTFTPAGGGAAMACTRVYIGMSPSGIYYLANGGTFSAPLSLPAINDGYGNTWIPIEMYVTGTNLQFYMTLQVAGDPSRTQLVAALLQEHSYSGTIPKTPPYDLSLAPIPAIPTGTSYSLATSGSMQGHTEQNINNGAFGF